MKLKIEADLSPAELREFLGMPDVRSIQEKWMAGMEERIMAEAANLAPDKILQSWIGGASSNVEMMSKLFEGFTGLGKK